MWTPKEMQVPFPGLRQMFETKPTTARSQSWQMKAEMKFSAECWLNPGHEGPQTAMSSHQSNSGGLSLQSPRLKNGKNLELQQIMKMFWNMLFISVFWVWHKERAFVPITLWGGDGEHRDLFHTISESLNVDPNLQMNHVPLQQKNLM